MQLDNLEQMTEYLQTGKGIGYQSAMYLAIKHSVEHGCPETSNDQKRGIVLQLANCLGEITLDNPYHFLTNEFGEFEIGREEGRQIYRAFLEARVELPALGEIEVALQDLRHQYRQLKGWLDNR
jgi:hypothetical protein